MSLGSNRGALRQLERLAVTLLVSNCLILAGCAPVSGTQQEGQSDEGQPSASVEAESNDSVENTAELDFSSMDSDELLAYAAASAYAGISNGLNQDNNVNLELNLVDVTASYVSSEYLEEVEYNSKENIFFGYTLDELEQQFDGACYTFTLGDDGETQVVQDNADATTHYEKMVKDVEMGAGVILLAVTVAIPAAATAAGAAGAGAANTVRAVMTVGATAPENIALTAAYAAPSIGEVAAAAARGDSAGVASGAADLALATVPIPGAGKCAAIAGKVAKGKEVLSRGAKKVAVTAANAVPFSDKVIKASKNIKTIPNNLNAGVTELNGIKYRWRFVVANDGTIMKGNFPVFDSKCNVNLPKDMLQASDKSQFKYCSEKLRDTVNKNDKLKSIFNSDQLAQIENGETPDGYTWHHNERTGLMQLVDSATHSATPHTGGRAIWGGGSEKR
jgi:hypothetical protein